MTSGLEALIADLGGGSKPRPVERWNPARCGEIDIRILKDGRWLHEGRPIVREPLVRLFASVLRRDEDGFYLVTPAEKLKIVVEDAPFVAVAMEAGDDGVLRFVTNVGDLVEADSQHPLRVLTDADGQPAPYLLVRGGLEARVSRPTFYELAGMAAIERGRAVVRSKGVAFDLGPVEAAP